jgi:hypothetical protein
MAPCSLIHGYQHFGEIYSLVFYPRVGDIIFPRNVLNHLRNYTAYKDLENYKHCCSVTVSHYQCDIGSDSCSAYLDKF